MLQLNENARRTLGALLIRALLVAAPVTAAVSGGCGLLVAAGAGAGAGYVAGHEEAEDEIEDHYEGED